MSRLLPQRGSLRIPGFGPASSSALALGLAGCLYGFAGGGFPGDIRTVAVLPFENLTSDPALTAEVTEAVREAVERRLGLRPTGERQADALVTGTITRYEPDLPVAFRGGDESRVEVTKRLVQIVVNVQIRDQRAERMLWEGSNLRLDGEYETGRESEGRRLALQKLTVNIVDGAQSQW